jgi:hypothetical protein
MYSNSYIARDADGDFFYSKNCRWGFASAPSAGREGEDSKKRRGFTGWRGGAKPLANKATKHAYAAHSSVRRMPSFSYVLRCMACLPGAGYVCVYVYMPRVILVIRVGKLAQLLLGKIGYIPLKEPIFRYIPSKDSTTSI